MRPILFEFGSFRIFSYGVMVALGFVIAVILAARKAGKAGLEPVRIYDIGLYSLLFGLAGARLLHVLLNIGYYSANIREVIMLNRGGLAFQGGLVAGFAAAVFYVNRFRMPLWKTADLMSPYIALGQAIGRIGCFLNGCCYGIPTDLPLGVRFAGLPDKVHPVQLYSSLALFALFFVLLSLYRKKMFDGSVFLSYILLYSGGRFLFDFIRGDLAAVFFGLRISQCISLAMLLAGAFMWKIRRRLKAS